MARMNIDPVLMTDDDNGEGFEKTATAAELSDEEVQEDHTMPIGDHERTNQTVLDEDFHYRMLDDRGFMLHVTRNRWARISASLLRKHIYCRAALYRRESFFRRASFEDFIQLCRIKRGEDPFADDPDWERIRRNTGRRFYLNDFERLGDRKKDLSEWLSTLVTLVAAVKRPDFKEKKKLAIRGALAYTDPDSHQLDPTAGYYGYADYVFPSGPTYFAGVELKIHRTASNRPWYQLGSVLAQIICWLGGTREMQVGLVLTNRGFKLLFRRLVDIVDGIPVFEYFHCCFDGENDDQLNLMTGKTGRVNRERLMRIIYEIVKVTGRDSIVSEKAAKKSSPVVEAYSDSRPTSARDEDQPETKRSRRQSDRENRGSGGGKDAPAEHIKEVLSSHRFYVRLSDGSLMPFEGMELQEDSHV